MHVARDRKARTLQDFTDVESQKACKIQYFKHFGRGKYQNPILSVKQKTTI